MTTTFADSSHHYAAPVRKSEGVRALVAMLRRWLTDLEVWMDNREKYLQTVRELSALTDRELADIGIARYQIREVARGDVTSPDHLD